MKRPWGNDSVAAKPLGNDIFSFTFCNEEEKKSSAKNGALAFL